VGIDISIIFHGNAIDFFTSSSHFGQSKNSLNTWTSVMKFSASPVSDAVAKPPDPEACAPGIIPVETIPARVVPASINVRLDIGVIVVSGLSISVKLF
jgi:hypothetical protein